MKSRFVCLILLAALGGCRETAKKAPVQQQPEGFRMVEVPAMLSSPQERAEFVTKNYWNHFDFTDTTLISRPAVTEQAFADYVNILLNVPTDMAAASVRTTLSKAEADTAMYRYFTTLFEKYLYDPNSPMRNEEVYIPVLEAIVASDRVDEADKIRPRYRLALAQKNRPGRPAADFTYTLSDGRTGTLYGVKADYVILFINNPGCTACKESIEQIEQSPLVSRMIGDGRVKVVALYPDEDMKAWRDYLSHFPPTWINGYDAGLKIKEGELYDLKAIPTLYLLSRDKTVILKDAPFGAIEQYLGQQAQ